MVARVNVLLVLLLLADELGSLALAGRRRPTLTSLVGVRVEWDGALEPARHEALVDDVLVSPGDGRLALLLSRHSDRAPSVSEVCHHSLVTACTRRIPRLCISGRVIVRSSKHLFLPLFQLFCQRVYAYKVYIGVGRESSKP